MQVFWHEMFPGQQVLLSSYVPRLWAWSLAA